VEYLTYIFRLRAGADHSRLSSVTSANGRRPNSNYASGLNDHISRLWSLLDSSTTFESYITWVCLADYEGDRRAALHLCGIRGRRSYAHADAKDYFRVEITLVAIR
jgi:hypothetical protein